MTTIPEQMIAEAKKLVGVRYKDKGRDEYGCDCAGLIIMVAHRLGISDYDTLDYSRRPNEAEMRREMKRIPQIELLPNKWDWQTGDLGVFSDGGNAIHLGFLEVDEQGRWYVIHSWARAHKVVRSETSRTDLETNLNLRLRRVYRYKG